LPGQHDSSDRALQRTFAILGAGTALAVAAEAAFDGRDEMETVKARYEVKRRKTSWTDGGRPDLEKSGRFDGRHASRRRPVSHFRGDLASISPVTCWPTGSEDEEVAGKKGKRRGEKGTRTASEQE